MRTTMPSLARFAVLLLVATAVNTGALAATEEKPKPVDVSQATARQVFRDCPDCPQMVIVAAGTFTMGAPANEPGFFAIEGPQRKVTVPRFALGRYDVTRGQYALFVAATGRRTAKGCEWSQRKAGDADAAWNNLGYEQQDNHPVVCVSLKDAQDYAEWLSRQTGRAYRLPTEAEWEYAARAGSTTAYPWGDQASHDQANYGADKCCGPLKQGSDAWAYTSPVGSFPANAFGLFDMNGNVLQWVQDCLSMSYQGLPADGSANLKSTRFKTTGELADFNGLSSCDFNIVRGGDFFDPPAQVRSAFRNFAPPPGDKALPYRSGGLGFRLAASLP
jgi:formylglycine-generating enzyme required for sulfatase activity